MKSILLPFRYTLLWLALFAAHPSAKGELLIVFTSTASGFTIVASGDVDTEGLTYCREFTTDRDYLHSIANSQVLWRLNEGDAIYDFPALEQLFDPTEEDDIILEATEASGDTFGLYFDFRESLIYFDPDFVSGRIDGSLTFEGVDLATLNPIPQRLSWGPGPNQAVRIAIDPLDPAPPFEVTAIARNSSGHVAITWESEIGSNYRVVHSPAMREGTWNAVSEVLPGLAGGMSFTHTGAASDEAGFYRVVRSAQ